MKKAIWKNLSEPQRRDILKRPTAGVAEAAQSVRSILDDIRANGDSAVRAYTQKFDKYDPAPLFLSPAEIAAAAPEPELRLAIDFAYANIRRFHEQQGYRPYSIEVLPGVTCSRKTVPIGKVGLYVPGGTATLFSAALMLGAPSQIAGNPERILCTPGRDGKIHPAILYAARLCGIEKIARIGGAQAIGALAYGTDTMPAVDKILGPGNMYVTLAKGMVAQEAGG